MMRKTLGAALALMAFVSISSQAQTLFTYGNFSISKDEFLKAYTKNNIDKNANFSDSSLRSYIDLYALYKMKVKEAEKEKLDTIPTIKTELETYRNQLARNYLTDKEVTEKLTKEAYDRMKEDVHVAHILVASRSAEDTARAYAKIDSIYQQIKSGKADFASMAMKYSDDKGSAPKGGDIGFITALQVVYPFENVAYNTQPGQVSTPFRTQFGYHIIKVLEKRPSQGTVQVQQILLQTSQAQGAAGDAAAKAKADEIVSELRRGASFEDMVERYSEDKFTKNNGGKLEPFGVGRMTPVFENAAFALKNPGDISDPVRTEYGYHILKLVQKTPLDAYVNVAAGLQRRIENDGRAAVAKEAYQAKIEKDLGYKEFAANYASFLQAVPDDSLNQKTFDAKKYASMTAPLFEMGGKKYTQADFATFVATTTRGRIAGKKQRAFDDLLKMYKAKTINELQLANLEQNNKEFQGLMTEYHDGTLLFALMDKKVWGKASKDTTGLREFYAKNQSKYNWAPGFDGVVYQSGDPESLKTFAESVNAGTMVQAVLSKINTVEHPQIIQETHDGRYEFSAFSQLKASDYQEGKVTKMVNTGKPGTDFVIYARKIYNIAEPKTLDEARGPLISDYQNYLEQEWNQDLMKRYPVKIDNKVLKSLEK